MKHNKKIFILLDLMSLVCRYGYAINYKKKNDKKIGAIFGCLMMLKNICFAGNVSVVCALESKTTTLKKKFFQPYKKNRRKIDAFIIAQYLELIDIFDYIDVETIMLPGLEADDVIYYVHKHILQTNDNVTVYVCSYDKDMLQLLNESNDTFVLKGLHPKIFSYDNFLKKYNFSPNYFTDFLALIGDRVDNIPGLKRCGRVTATKLIQRYKTIDNMFQNVQEIQQNYKSILICNTTKQQLLTAKRLINFKIF